MEKDPTDLGQKLKQARISRDLNLEELGQLCRSTKTIRTNGKQPKADRTHSICSYSAQP